MIGSDLNISLQQLTHCIRRIDRQQGMASALHNDHTEVGVAVMEGKESAELPHSGQTVPAHVVPATFFPGVYFPHEQWGLRRRLYRPHRGAPAGRGQVRIAGARRGVCASQGGDPTRPAGHVGSGSPCRGGRAATTADRLPYRTDRALTETVHGVARRYCADHRRQKGLSDRQPVRFSRRSRRPPLPSAPWLPLR